MSSSPTLRIAVSTGLRGSVDQRIMPGPIYAPTPRQRCALTLLSHSASSLTFHDQLLCILHMSDLFALRPRIFLCATLCFYKASVQLFVRPRYRPKASSYQHYNPRSTYSSTIQPCSLAREFLVCARNRSVVATNSMLTHLKLYQWPATGK